MINGFSEWASSEGLILSGPTEGFRGKVLAIDAEDYIQRLLTDDATKEPLLAALGGIPFSFEKNLEAEIALWRESGITPYFIFNGLTPRASEDRKAVLRRQLFRKIDEAWDQYDASNADRAVLTFGMTCTYDLEHIYRYTQLIFHRHGVPFKSGPYAVHAQMAHMEKDSVVNGIFGSSELLFYDCGKIILDFDLRKKEFSWVSRQACIDSLTNGDADLWVDCCLLAGSSLLPQLPQLDNDRSPKIRAAAELIRHNAVDGANSICLQYRDDPVNQELDYLTNYRKAVLSIKYHIVKKWHAGTIVTNQEEAPSDVHNFIGQRLPDEVYDYVSAGAIGTRVLNWRTSGHIKELQPIDGGNSALYETVIRDRITPQRLLALRLLSQSLHRFYQHKNISLHLYFDPAEPKELRVNDVGDLQNSINAWNVHMPQISKMSEALQAKPASLLAAIESLSSSEIAKETVTPKDKGYEPLKNVIEIKCNALWRFLQLKGYIDQAHNLTPLGIILHNAYKMAQSKGMAPADYEEPLFLGIEASRLQLQLTQDQPPQHGQPVKGTLTDHNHIRLICRVACFGRLAHTAIGYTGPLSRPLLAYRTMVSVLRQTQRDILDMSLATMWLDGQIYRLLPTKQVAEAGLSLPFLIDGDCALAVAVKQYLEEHLTKQHPISPEVRQATIKKGQSTWIPHAVDFGASIEYAFKLWDVLVATMKEMPTSIAEVEKQVWIDADEWLKERR